MHGSERERKRTYQLVLSDLDAWEVQLSLTTLEIGTLGPKQFIMHFLDDTGKGAIT